MEQDIIIIGSLKGEIRLLAQKRRQLSKWKFYHLTKVDSMDKAIESVERNIDRLQRSLELHLNGGAKSDVQKKIKQKL